MLSFAMKKLSLLVGTLGGAMAGYLFSNKKLREELSIAKDAEAAAKMLGKHLQRDGKKFAKHVQEFVESDDVQRNLSTAKKYAGKHYDRAVQELGAMVGQGRKKAGRAVKKKASAAKEKVKKSVAKKKVLKKLVKRKKR